jgi:hypothetical protein
MVKPLVITFACVALATAAPVAGCGSGSGGGTSSGTDDGGSSSSSGGGSSSSSSSSGAGSSSGTGSSSGSTSSSGTGSSSGGSSSSSGGDSGIPTHAGNPNGSCSAGLPAGGQPVDTSHPTTVIGSGTASSCTFAKLQAAVTAGGIITFDCGSAPVTIAVTAQLDVPITTSTVIDGGNKITLDGGGAVRILSFDSPNWVNNTNRLTLQHITLVNGKTTPTQKIPPAPAPCSQGWDDGQGGAVYMRDGSLTVIDSIFANNQAAPLGPDTGGGAIYVQGSLHGMLIVSSTFTNNTGANAGAVGGLWSELDVYNSLVTGNSAIGHDANNNDPKTCSAMNNGQNEVGSGGNGGALYSDGNSRNITLCGDAIDNNAAGVNAFGGGVFFTSDDMMGTLTITDTTIQGNTGGHWTNVTTGSVTNAGTAIGVNAKSITITNSMVQGHP